MNDFELGREIERINQRITKLENLSLARYMTKDNGDAGGGVDAADLDKLAGATRGGGTRR